MKLYNLHKNFQDTSFCSVVEYTEMDSQFIGYYLLNVYTKTNFQL